MKVGIGYDIHRLVTGRKLWIGGVEIPFSRGEKGHSDGDVLLHAIMDALLGAAAQGDIGQHFPPEDLKYRDISSRVLLEKILAHLSGMGILPGNIDCTVIIKKPKLSPYIRKIRERLAEDLKLNINKVSVKAKTKEGIGLVGRGRAVEALAVALVDSE